MAPTRSSSPSQWGLATVLLAAVGAAGGFYGWNAWQKRKAAARVPKGSETMSAEAAALSPESVHVEVVRPVKGDMDRTTTQPGTVQSYEKVQLYAGVSGYLRSQSVDIGDRVKPGQVLAQVDVPELQKQIQRYSAGVDQARARVSQMEARVASAKADLEAAHATVIYAEANAKSKAAELRFRQKQLNRMKELWEKDRAVDERLVDEKTEQRDAAQETERSAVAAIASAKAQTTAAAAKIRQAEADVVEAEAHVKVAQADLEKAQVMVKFATVVSPFEGVVTHRSLFPGDFVRAANEGGTHTALLTVERTDRMRVIVQIPDRDVPYTDPGDPAIVEVDALPGEKFPAKVSRIASSEDPQTRLMHIEIDLPNPTGKICQGMYGRVKIILQKSDLLSVPSSCVVERFEDSKGTVYVVRDGHIRRVPVRFSEDNGLKVGIVSGWKPDDAVVLHPNGSLPEGTPVVTDSPTHVAAGR